MVQLHKLRMQGNIKADPVNFCISCQCFIKFLIPGAVGNYENGLKSFAKNSMDIFNQFPEVGMRRWLATSKGEPDCITVELRNVIDSLFKVGE